nr:MAG TPA: hypothetical protein [Bacteriophage sp.]
MHRTLMIYYLMYHNQYFVLEYYQRITYSNILPVFLHFRQSSI